MSDDVLERIGDQLRPADDPLDRLRERRERRARRQRLGAAALALAIVIVGGTSAWVALRPAAVERTPPASEEDVPDVARVECDGTQTRVESSTIRPRPDGVHFEFRNTSVAEVMVDVEHGAVGDGHPVAPGATETFVTTEAPGPASVLCSPVGSDPSGFERVPIQVVDPEGEYVSARGQPCPGGMGGTAGGSFAEPPPGEDFDPVERTRQRFAQHLRPDDTLTRVGYPESTQEAVVVVIRDGYLVLTTTYSAGPQGWVDDGNYWACSLLYE